jgi:hypothetical protein
MQGVHRRGLPFMCGPICATHSHAGLHAGGALPWPPLHVRPCSHSTSTHGLGSSAGVHAGVHCGVPGYHLRVPLPPPVLAAPPIVSPPPFMCASQSVPPVYTPPGELGRGSGFHARCPMRVSGGSDGGKGGRTCHTPPSMPRLRTEVGGGANPCHVWQLGGTHRAHRGPPALAVLLTLTGGGDEGKGGAYLV